VGARDAAWLRRSGARRMCGIEHVDIDRDIEFVRLGECLADRVAHHVLEAAVPDLLHGVPGHALFEHPLECVLRWPVPAQANLDEMGAWPRSRLDEPAHRGAVAGQVALD